MEQIDVYFVGKRNIMQAVLNFYKSEVEKEQPLILDIGCGRGAYLNKLTEGTYIGLDINSESIKLAHKIHPDKMFVVGDATKLPFKDQIFDCIICNELLEHIPDDTAALIELARVTKNSGKLLASVPNIECENVFVKLQRSLIDTEVGHCREGYSISEVSKLIAKSGFKVQKYKYGCGLVTAVVEYSVIKLGGIFGYKPSNLNRLFEQEKPLLAKLALKIYKLLSPILISFTYLDKLLPEGYKSNIVISAVKRPHFEGKA